MLTPHLRKCLKRIQYFARRLAKGEQSGRYRSLYRGQGMDFEEVREYVAGDDVRKMDWNVTARMQAPHVKVFREEKESTLLLCIDASASMWFGGSKTKIQLAAELATLFACLSSEEKDQVGLLVFADKELAFVPPKAGKEHLNRVLSAINGLKRNRFSTNMQFATDRVLRLPGRRMHVLWFSDFLHLPTGDSFWTKSVRSLQSKHQMQFIHVSDRLEAGIDNTVVWRDSEDGSVVQKGFGRFFAQSKPASNSNAASSIPGDLLGFWPATTDEGLVDLFRRFMVRPKKPSPEVKVI